jgi:pimeloyl-ACP methyl ester carboxylesterase
MTSVFNLGLTMRRCRHSPAGEGATGRATAERPAILRLPTPRPPVAVRLLAAALLATGVLAGFLLTACGGQSSTTATSATAETLPAAGRAVNFTTEDGVALDGHVFGSGQAGVVLAHMYPADETSWYATAERLAQEGYLVLTFDFRGYGESSGEKQIGLIDRDVDAAIAAIRKEGAAEVVLAGASMGGTASLVAGDRAQALSSIRLAGIATLSAPVEFRGLSAADAVPRIMVPLLFIAAEKDEGAAGARELEQLSSDKGELKIVPGSDHGTDLLTGDQGEKVYGLLRGFIEDSLAP